MSNQKPVQILSVRSNNEIGCTIQNIINQFDDLELQVEALDAAKAMECLSTNSIDLALVDLAVRDSIKLIKHIRESYQTVRVLVVTASDDPLDIFAAMDAGADAYVLKKNLCHVLESALRSARLGAVWLDPDIAKQVLMVVEAEKKASPKLVRTIPTGLMILPLLPKERSILDDVATSDCKDGVCMVDPSFLRKLRRFAPSEA